MKPINPFLIAGYYSPEYFCDRKQEADTLIDALQNGRNLTLISPRRMGKTGLIKHIFHRLKEQQPEVVTLYMDIFSTQNLGEFVRILAGAVLGSLDSTSQKAMNRVGKFIKSIRPSITFDELTGIPQISIEMAPDKEEASLKEIFSYLEASGKRCIIAIDEFQQIAEYPEKGMEALLRSHIQFLSGVHFIFAGSKQHIMQEMFLSAKRPFYQSTQLLTIDRIDREEYFHFASAFFNGKKQVLDSEVFSYIYDEFDGHTWYIQTILNRLYGYRIRPDKMGVHTAIAQIISELESSYEMLLAAYSSANVKLLKAIAQEKCVKNINAGEFIARYKLKATSSVNTSLQKLLDKELVYKTYDGYIVYDRLMAVWLRQQPY